MISTPLTPYLVWIKIGLVVALGAGMWLHGYSAGKKEGRERVADMEAKHAQQQAEAAALYAQQVQANRKQESDWQQVMAEIATKFEQDKTRIADETQASVLADIRAGRVRVRFPTCPGVPASAGASAGTRVDHDAADVRPEDALHLAVAQSIELADRADLDIETCQAAHRAVRGPKP